MWRIPFLAQNQQVKLHLASIVFYLLLSTHFPFLCQKLYYCITLHCISGAQSPSMLFASCCIGDSSGSLPFVFAEEVVRVLICNFTERGRIPGIHPLPIAPWQSPTVSQCDRIWLRHPLCAWWVPWTPKRFHVGVVAAWAAEDVRKWISNWTAILTTYRHTSGVLCSVTKECDIYCSLSEAWQGQRKKDSLCSITKLHKDRKWYSHCKCLDQYLNSACTWT